MSGDTEDPEAAASRLEAALERIAKAAVRPAAPQAEQIPGADSKTVAARLDALIDRLRTALGERAE
jgi:hypothetical protein